MRLSHLPSTSKMGINPAFEPGRRVPSAIED
jgi:hypothetical protein